MNETPGDEDGGGCPVRRLTAPEGTQGNAPAVEQVRGNGGAGIHGARWVIRSYAAAQELISAERNLRQAGFGALTFIKPDDRQSYGDDDGDDDGDEKNDKHGWRRRSWVSRPPVLYIDGPEHRDRRRAAARFFTPRAVDSYRDGVDDLARRLVAPVASGRTVDVSKLALDLTVFVVARVTGLTSSRLTGLDRRIEATFAANLDDQGGRLVSAARRLVTLGALIAFYVFDVLPAIRNRRRRPGDDLISHLLQVGFRPLEILTECLIYCAAGIATTREFITLATWYLLDHPDLRAEFRDADQAGRTAILHEMLRLEPVVGHLYRRVVKPTALKLNGGQSIVLPTGSIVDLDLRAVNTDAALVGPEPIALHPGRPMSLRGAAPVVLGFGDGQHRCPGAPLAMLESERFLHHLIAADLVLADPPKVSWNDLTGGYELRGLTVKARQCTDSPRRPERLP